MTQVTEPLRARRNHKFALLAAVLAPMLAGPALMVWAGPPYADFWFGILLTNLFSLAASVLIGMPVHFVLGWLGRSHVAWYLAGGVIAAALTAYSFVGIRDALLLYGPLGAVCGAAFWSLAVLLPRRLSQRETAT